MKLTGPSFIENKVMHMDISNKQQQNAPITTPNADNGDDVSIDDNEVLNNNHENGAHLNQSTIFTNLNTKFTLYAA